MAPSLGALPSLRSLTVAVRVALPHCSTISLGDFGVAHGGAVGWSQTTVRVFSRTRALEKLA